MLVTVKRTKQIAQFEPLTIEQSIEVEDYDQTMVNTEIMLAEIDAQIEQYMSKHGEGAGVGLRRLAELSVMVATGKPMLVEDLESLSAKESVFINEVQKALYRTKEYKYSKVIRSVENEQNRK